MWVPGCLLIASSEWVTAKLPFNCIMFFFFQIQYLHLKLPSSPQHTHVRVLVNFCPTPSPNTHFCLMANGHYPMSPPFTLFPFKIPVCDLETVISALTDTRNDLALCVCGWPKEVGWLGVVFQPTFGWLSVVCAVWQLNCLPAPVPLFAFDIFNLHDSCAPTSSSRQPDILGSWHTGILAGTLAAAQPQPFNLSRKSIPDGTSGFSGAGSTDLVLANTSRTTVIFTQDLLYTGNKLLA